MSKYHATVTQADRERFEKFADPGECSYCGDGPVRPDPFSNGTAVACVQCFADICFGPDDDE